MGVFLVLNSESILQNPLGLSSRERGRYDLQTIIFGRMKNEGNIAVNMKKGVRL
jgi:hypothetical protein